MNAMFLKYINRLRREIVGFVLVFLLLLGLEVGYVLLHDEFRIQVATAEEAALEEWLRLSFTIPLRPGGNDESRS